MTTRGQNLRSSTPGNMPAAGTRQPGELWITFPDIQIGYIDASRNAQKVVAVRFFSALANYVAGDFVIQAGVLYAAKASTPAGAFNISQWTRIGAATDAGGPYLPIAGGTLTGDLVLNRDPQVALGSATKQYVDGKVTAAPFLPIAGGTLTGFVTLSGPPIIPLHAATKAYVDSGAFVPIGGGTMQGDLILNRDAQVALGAATKEQVDARGAGDNRLINGDMRIDARNNGASVVGAATLTYAVDRWAYQASQASKGSYSRSSVSAFPGFPYALLFTSSSAFASAAGDYFIFLQSIEADMVSDFQWGTANAQPVTLSFWAFSSLSGTFSGSIRNAANNRSYPFAFTLAGAATKVVITIPGDTAGTWGLSGVAAALNVNFNLGSGSSSLGPAGAWGSAPYLGATGSISVVGTNGATFYVTGVKLEIGSVATPFNRQSLAKSMADCQRYYCDLANGGSSQAYYVTCYAPVASTFNTATVYLPVPMRATPTLVLRNQSYNLPATSMGAAAYSNATVLTDLVTNGAGNAAATFNMTASAEL